jgi:hypothetical protein
MSPFEEIRPQFEISSKVESVACYAFEGIYPLQDSGVETKASLSLSYAQIERTRCPWVL